MIKYTIHRSFVSSCSSFDRAMHIITVAWAITAILEFMTGSEKNCQHRRAENLNLWQRKTRLPVNAKFFSLKESLYESALLVTR